MIRGIIFDCFGVLYVDVKQAYFARFPKLRDELHALNVMSDRGFIDKATYISQVAKLTGISENETIQGFAKEHVLNKELVEYIPTLKKHYKVALLSNVSRDWLDDFFNERQLHNLFDEVVISGEEGIIKPDPEIFERTAEKLGLTPKECVMVDDRQENCAGAEAAGMKSLYYNSNTMLMAALEKLEKEIT